MVRVLKVLALAAGAGALKGLSDQLPDVLPAELGGPVAVALAAAVAYLLPSPKGKARTL